MRVYCIICIEYKLDIENSIFCRNVEDAILIAKKNFGIDVNKNMFVSSEEELSDLNDINVDMNTYYCCSVDYPSNSGWIPYIEVSGAGYFVGGNPNIPKIFSNRDFAEEFACQERDRQLANDKFTDAKFFLYPIKIK